MKIFPVRGSPRTAMLAASLLAPVCVVAHGPHEHGAATLSVALDETRLEATLVAPADSIVGFEHAPRDDAERAALAHATALLDTPARWIVPAADAQCVSEPGSASFDRDGDHANVTARAIWQCAKPAALTTLDLPLFAAFPRLERVTADLVLPDRQDSRTLTPHAARLTLAP